VVRFATEWAALPISLSGLVVFPHPATTLWAAPVVTPALLARQAELHAALHDLPIHPHYRPDAWVPHVTLSGALADPGAALTAVLKLWRPLNGWLDRLDLVRFRPVQILQSHALPQ
jgi:2'-5' RNA ligase